MSSDPDAPWPPPVVEHPVSTTGGPSRTERRWGLASLWLALASVLLSLLSASLALANTMTPHGVLPIMLIPNLLAIFALVGIVTSVASVVMGLAGRRTATGRAGVILTLALGIVIFGIYLLGRFMTDWGIR